MPRHCWTRGLFFSFSAKGPCGSLVITRAVAVGG